MQGSKCDKKNLELDPELDGKPRNPNWCYDWCHVRPFGVLGSQKYNNSNISDYL